MTDSGSITSSTRVDEPGRPARERFTARELHESARDLQAGRIRWATVGWIVVLAALALNLLGIVAIATTEPGFARKQALFLPLGLIVAAVVAVPDYRRLRRLVPGLSVLVLALLVFVLIPFVPTWLVRPYNGARRWINLGITDLQPSELAKVVWVLALAAWFRLRWNVRSLRGFALPFVVTAIPMGLILLEPDLGTALLFVPTLLALLLVAGAKVSHLTILVLSGVLAMSAVLFTPVRGYLKEHQQDRIEALLAQIEGDDRYRDDIGYQGDRAMTLAVLAIGGFLVAAFARDLFGRLLATGLVTLLLAQMVINTGMTIGLLPITGMTLPFVSAGGSSLVTAWMMIGLVLNVGLRRPRRMEQWEVAGTG